MAFLPSCCPSRHLWLGSVWRGTGECRSVDDRGRVHRSDWRLMGRIHGGIATAGLHCVVLEVKRGLLLLSHRIVTRMADRRLRGLLLRMREVPVRRGGHCLGKEHVRFSR